MVSKRKYFSIVIMMLVLLFLFQFSVVMRDQQNAYDTNSYFSLKAADGKNEWKASAQEGTEAFEKRKKIVFIGDKSCDMAVAVSRWCTYAKRELCFEKSASDLKEKAEELPEMIILESEKRAIGNDLEALKKMESQGAIVVFGCLENPELIQAIPKLMDFLGIKKVVANETTLSGVKLFDGLLLGGSVVYEAGEEEEEKERQDLQLKVPWYQLGSGTTTYMMGLLDESSGENVRNEELPSLIWRNGLNNSSVFAVTGDYMKDSTALGILDGMLAEGSEYALYPVVNAQNLSMVNFPVFADENNEEMQKLYSQSMTGIARDIMWSSLISIVEKSGRKMTCFIQPQADYEDSIEPDAQNLKFYLQQMKEQNAEAGLSLQYQNTASFEEKLKKDDEFFQNENSSYIYGTAFTEAKNINSVLQLENTELLKNVSTLICEYTEEKPVLSYCSDFVTLQSVTSDGMNYTYSDDIRMRSIQSALGYTNVMLNMYDIFWPQKDTDRWEIMQKRFSSNLLTYWKEFSCFASTTLSESNTRTRTFLNLDYSEQREENKIILQTSLAGSWFILRTHGEEIADIQGGSQIKIQEDAYLICAEDTTVEIKLQERWRKK